jgi:hypothetical protein
MNRVTVVTLGVADLEGYHWEVVGAPMFDFTDDGALLYQRKQ